jgi:hypothetical protein
VLPWRDCLVAERKENIGWVAVSFQSPRKVLITRQSVASLSTAHEGVIALRATVQRFPTAGVSSVTERSSVALYPRRVAEFGSVPVRIVASALQSLRARPVVSASVVERPVASAFRSVPPRSVASALQSSPRVVLAPAVQVWRRAAAAKTCVRIAQRLARLAAGRPRQQVQ